MRTIQAFPNIAFLFAALSLGTAWTLYSGMVRWVELALAIFWLGTGLLACYQCMKKYERKK
jgi:hypothetical protein